MARDFLVMVSTGDGNPRKFFVDGDRGATVTIYQRHRGELLPAVKVESWHGKEGRLHTSVDPSDSAEWNEKDGAAADWTAERFTIDTQREKP